MSDTGIVVHVEITPIGSTLIEDSAADATVLQVDDNQAFTAGTVIVASVGENTIEATVAANPAAGDTTSVHLASALGAAGEAFDTFLAPAPARQTTTAFVDDGIGDEPLPCVVIHTLQDALPAGPREPGEGETVVYRRDDTGQLQVTDVVDKVTVRDLSNVDVTTAPPGLGGDSGPTDPPAVSPNLQILEGPDNAVVRFTPTTDAQAYDLYVASGTVAAGTDGTPVHSPPATAPGPADLHTRGATPGMQLRFYPDGTLLPLGGASVADGALPEPDAWFALVARNTTADGDELTADPSAWVAGRRGRIDEDTLRVGLLLAQDAVLDAVQTQGIQMGTHSWNQITGLTIPDVLEVPPNDATAAKMLARFVARSIEVLNFLKIGGRQNEVSTGAELVLADGATAPTAAPTVTSDWVVAANLPVQSPTDVRSMVRVSDTEYYTLESVSQDSCRIVRWVDGAVAATRFAWHDGRYGMARLGTGEIIVGGRNGNVYFERITANLSSLVRRWVPNREANTNGTRYYLIDSGSLHVARGSSTVIRLVGWVKNELYNSSGYVLAAVEWDADEPDAVARRYDTFNYSGSKITVTGVALGRVPGSTVDSWVLSRPSGDALVFDTSRNRQTAREFPRARGRVIAGVSHDTTGTVLYSIDTGGLVYRYAPTALTGQVAYSFRDTDPAGTGLHETSLSPMATISVVKGAVAKVSVAPVADSGDADSPDVTTLYSRAGTSGTWYLQGDVPQDTLARVVAAHPTAGTSHPQHQSFANAQLTPAALRSQTGGVQITGNGGGSVGTGGFRDSVIAAVRSLLGLSSYASGRVNVVFNNTNAASVAVTFPTGRFAVAPAGITVQPANSTLVGFYTNLTATGMTVGGRRYDGTNINVTIELSWTASS